MLARVPFDEGSLTGRLTREARWPEGDWRNNYFTPENLAATLERVEALLAVVPPGMGFAGARASFHPAASGGDDDDPGHAEGPARRTQRRGERRHAARAAVLDQLRDHRWDRTTVIP